jgi:hypothetical protein
MEDQMKAALWVLVPAMLAGCGTTYMRVDSRLVESTRDSAAEITPTAQYEQDVGAIKQVALREPDSCANETAAAATGAARIDKQTVSTLCGVEMAELERALTRAGYVVSSWKALGNMVRVDQITPVEAARRLGAQVLFQVNSLEKAQVMAGHDARWERSYGLATEYADVIRPAQVTENTAGQLKAMVRPMEQMLLAQERIGAMLDVNAIMVATGQTIWFYRWVKIEPQRQDNNIMALAKETNKDFWMAVSPRPREVTGNVSVVRSGEVEAVSRSGRSADEQKALYFQLLRSVVSNFVKEFSGGRNIAAIPMPPRAPRPAAVPASPPSASPEVPAPAPAAVPGAAAPSPDASPVAASAPLPSVAPTTVEPPPIR